jgi:hypothetical protein
VIVRIATEAQYEISQADYEALNDLDNQVVAAVEAGDEAAFKQAFAQFVEGVRSKGTEVADDDLRESDVILPPSDIDLEEAKRDFSGEGVIPDSLLPGSA